MALRIFGVRKPAAGMLECTSVVRDCMERGELGTSARQGVGYFFANAVVCAPSQLQRQERRRVPSHVHGKQPKV